MNHYDYCDHVYCSNCPDDGWCCKFDQNKVCLKHGPKKPKDEAKK